MLTQEVECMTDEEIEALDISPADKEKKKAEVSSFLWFKCDEMAVEIETLPFWFIGLLSPNLAPAHPYPPLPTPTPYPSVPTFTLGSISISTFA